MTAAFDGDHEIPMLLADPHLSDDALILRELS
jgi:hypothetical protein